MTELDKLEKYLKEKGIRYKRIDIDKDDPIYYDRHQIVVPSFGDECEWDAICQRGSLGYEEGLLEICGDLVDEEKDGDSVVGWLTAQDVIERIEKPKQAESGFIPQEKSKNELIKTTDNLRRMTYDELLEMFEDRFPLAKYVDYRPICHEMFTDDKITIFFENGDVIEYYPATAERKESCKT